MEGISARRNVLHGISLKLNRIDKIYINFVYTRFEGGGSGMLHWKCIRSACMDTEIFMPNLLYLALLKAEICVFK